MVSGRIDDYVTPRDAAQIKGVLPPAVYDAIHARRLTPYSIFGQTVVLRAEVEAWKVRTKRRVKKEIGEIPK